MYMSFSKYITKHHIKLRATREFNVYGIALQNVTSKCMHADACIYIYIYRIIPYQCVPHKAVAEVSKIANSRRLAAVNHGSQSNPLMDRKVVGGSAV